MTRILSLLLVVAANSFAAEKPNIVLIMADDLGLGDVSHHVRTQMKKEPLVETPNIDALARQSLWFTDGHSATALCSPTRYSMMSGNTNYRSYAPWGVWGTFRKSAMVKGEVTLGSVVRDAGYATGFVGKWHLGGDFRDKKTGGFYRGTDNGDIIDKVDVTRILGGGPRYCGFDYDFTVPCGIQGPVYTVYENQKWHPFAKDSEIVFLNEKNALFPKDVSDKGPGPGDSKWNARQLGKMISQKAVEFIDRNAGKKPFFLYYCSHSVHIPHCPPEEFDGNKVKGSTPSAHLDMVVELDLQVKRIVDALKANKVFDNTLIVVTSDNGGLLINKTIKAGHQSSGGWAGSKNKPEEGGHRVPFFAVWKGHIKPGVTDEPAINQDMLATLASLVGTPIPEDEAMDSSNLLPLLTGKGKYVPREFMVQQAGSGKEIIYRKWPWKLIIQSDHALKKFEPSKLYNLEENPTENPELNKVNEPEFKELTARMLKDYLEIQNSGRRTAPYNP
ncbi:MAG: arylsulfatase [Verrucomicrobiota bacterium]